jgi:hypothetical protein
MCGEPIVPGAPVIFAARRPCHLRCVLDSQRDVDAVRAFLQKTPGEVCDACVATALGIDPEAARKAIYRLRSDPAFPVEAASTCAACGERRATIRRRAT